MPGDYNRFLPTYVPVPVELPSRATAGMLILHLNAALILCKNVLVRKCCIHTFIQIRSPCMGLLFQEFSSCEHVTLYLQVISCTLTCIDSIDTWPSMHIEYLTTVTVTSQVSLGKMTIDIYKYIIIFAIIISAFTAGLARFYQYYDGMVYEDEFGMKTVQVTID